MRLPVLQGLIKRRLLINFRADPRVVQTLLPPPFRPKLHQDQAIVGLCLIRLEQIRPRHWPALLGHASENAAHRMAVEWDGPDGQVQEGVFIPRRDTASTLNWLAGGRVFPGEHHAATIQVADSGERVELKIDSRDGTIHAHVIGDVADALPQSSCFRSIAEASSFFERGSLGYSVTRAGTRLDGLTLRPEGWSVRALTMSRLDLNFFTDPLRFPTGSIEFDHALIMRDIPHEWHEAAALESRRD